MQLVKTLRSHTAHADARPLIKGDAYQQILGARELLDAAQEEARALVAAAEKQRAQVFADARAAARQEADDEALARTLAQAKQLETWVDAVKPRLASAVRVAVRKLLEAEPPAERLEQALGRALSSAGEGHALTLRLHPSLLAEFEARLARLRARQSLPAEVRLKPDERLAVGDGVLESALGVLDLRLDAQLQSLNLDSVTGA